MSGLRAWAAGAAGFLMIAGAAEAARLSIPLAGTDVIVSEEGAARILLAYEPLELPGPSPAWVTTAYLEIPVPAVAAERRLDLQVYSVPTAWVRGAATWTSPWRTPGGDVEGNVPYAEFDGSDTSGRLTVDVTSLVQEAFRRGDNAARFLLTVPSRFGSGLRVEDRNRLGTLEGATLHIVYVHAGPREEAVSPRG